MKTKIQYAEPYRRGGDLFRVILHQYDQSEKQMWSYEIWGTREAVEDTLRISRYPRTSDLTNFAITIYEKRMRDVDYAPKDYEGAFAITADTIKYGDYRTFPGSMIDDTDVYVQTNVSFPKSLHEKLKIEGVKNNDSLSETLRKAAEFYLRRTFICDSCGKEKHGEPEIKGDCRECFLEAFARADKGTAKKS